jgi:hypothetical protein
LFLDFLGEAAKDSVGSAEDAESSGGATLAVELSVLAADETILVSRELSGWQVGQNNTVSPWAVHPFAASPAASQTLCTMPLHTEHLSGACVGIVQVHRHWLEADSASFWTGGDFAASMQS